MKGKEITVHWKRVYPKFKEIVQEETESTVSVFYYGSLLKIDKKHIL